MTTPLPTCSTCRHFHATGHSRWLADVGTCDLGGPKPEEGSSDVGEDEACEKHERKETT